MSAKKRFTGYIVMVCVTSLLALGALPAYAHHKDDHEGGPRDDRGSQQSTSDHDGDADSDPGTAYTEDNDTNDGGTPNNVSDDGDNRHPSGRDRSVEAGGSGNQGNSESDPDDDGRGPDRSNGGPDKPNGSGGIDLADQDGNNGCGNDDDFEDDNEGWCGHKPELEQPSVLPLPPLSVCPEGTDFAGMPMTDLDDCDQPEGPIERDDDDAVPDDDDVLVNVIERPSGPKVLGTRVAAAPAALPFTGSGDVLPLALLGLILIAVGGLALRVRRNP